MAIQPPSNRQAVSTTLAAILDLMALFFLVAANAHPALLTCFALCEAVLIACAVAQWAKFTKAYIACEVERQLAQASPAEAAPAE
jgi:hypothetical protein